MTGAIITKYSNSGHAIIIALGTGMRLTRAYNPAISSKANHRNAAFALFQKIEDQIHADHPLKRELMASEAINTRGIEGYVHIYEPDYSER